MIIHSLNDNMRVNTAPLCADHSTLLFSRFHNKIHLSNVSIPGRIADRGPLPKLCIWYGQLSILNTTIKISIAIPFKHKTLFKCWASVADIDTALSQQGDKSLCVLGTLNTIPFDKQIYIYLKVQKPSGDF